MKVLRAHHVHSGVLTNKNCFYQNKSGFFFKTDEPDTQPEIKGAKEIHNCIKKI